MTPMVFLAELDLESPEHEPVTLYLSDVAMSPFPPDDPDRPNQVYDDRLAEPPGYEWSVSAEIATAPPSIGAGSLVIRNADGAITAYRDHLWLRARLYWGPAGAAFAAFQPFLTGRLAPPRWALSATQPSRVTVDLMDLRAALQDDIQTTVFAGTNVGAEGYEGLEADLAGQPKPLAFGDLTEAGVPAIWANGPRKVVQLHDGPIEAVLGIRHMGEDAGLADGGDHAGAAFDALTGADGYFATDLGRGLVMTTAALPGVVTFSLQGDAAGGYVDTAPAIIRRLIEQALGEDAAFSPDWDDFAAPAKVGLYLSAPTSRLDAIDRLARSFGGWALPDQLGRWRLGRLAAPAGPADDTWGEDDFVSLDADGQSFNPVSRLTVLYAENYRPLAEAEIAGVVSETEPPLAAALKQRWRRAVAEAPSAARWAGHRQVEMETCLREAADAQALASALLPALDAPRESLRVAVTMTPARLALAPWATIRLIYPPQGLDRLYALAGVSVATPNRGLMTALLWG
ncbi:MAG: hypothetical protein OHK0024_33420 [Thalassobaculales bacterium]